MNITTNQHKLNINKFVIIVSVVIVFVCIIVTLLTTANKAVETEKLLKILKRNSQSVYTYYGLKIMEAAQIPAMYKKDVLDITKTQMEDRYGKTGIKDTVQFLTEHNITITDNTYLQIQQMIEAGRNDIIYSQQRMNDVRRQYETSLRYPINGKILKVMGFPKVNLMDYKLLKTKDGIQIFESNMDKPIPLNGSH